MRILITGSRDWNSPLTIFKALLDVTTGAEYLDSNNITLVSGACPSGADKLAEDVASHFGWDIERHPADWQTHGRIAGPIRNKEMVDLGADVCLAFIKNNSKGASGTASMAEKAGIKTLRFTA